jgi:hypothetical protein
MNAEHAEEDRETAENNARQVHLQETSRLGGLSVFSAVSALRPFCA